MFFYVTNAKFVHNVEYQTLDSVAEPNHSKYVEQIVEWLEEKWGYLRDLGKDWRRADVLREEKDFFIVTYNKQPIGLFVLKDVENFRSMQLKELWCFYIDESFRGNGFAPRMMDMVKEVCVKEGVEMMVLDTFNPALNKFYEKRGAKVVCDGSFTVTVNTSTSANETVVAGAGEAVAFPSRKKITYPTTLMRMSFLPPSKKLVMEDHRGPHLAVEEEPHIHKNRP